MRLELERRPARGVSADLAGIALALAASLAIGVLLFLALGVPPLEALYVYFVEPLTDPWSLHELAIKATPLILIAVGLSVCFRSNNWNIGAEGQFVAGAIAASAVPVLTPAEGWWVLPAMMTLGMAGGAAWAAVPGVLKARLGTNEILVSLMLVYVAELLLDWLVRGPWRNPEGFNFPETRSFPTDAIIPEIVSQGALGGRANWGLAVALIAAVLTWIMLTRTLRGFEVTVTGESPRAARFAGFSAARTTVFAFLFSGALAGLAGTIEVSGAIGQLRPSISPGYGFTAIIVAFLGRLNPLGIVVAGLLLALTYIGGEGAQMSLGLTERFARVFQGVLLFSLLAADTLVRYRPRVRGSLRGRGPSGAPVVPPASVAPLATRTAGPGARA